MLRCGEIGRACGRLSVTLVIGDLVLLSLKESQPHIREAVRGGCAVVLVFYMHRVKARFGLNDKTLVAARNRTCKGSGFKRFK